MLRLGLSLACLGLSGCFFVFGGDDGDDVCLATPAAENEPEIAPAPLRDPGDLTCESFGTGCDPSCGPCPEATARIAEPTPPIPSWNYCGHRCETLNESQCAADAECRVVKDAFCTVRGDCDTDFVGCFPTDTQPATDIECYRTFDAWDCSRSNACTAIHGSGSAAARSPEYLRPFAMCVPEGKSPGQCWTPVACDAAAPSCPEGHVPGVEGACYTGGCIPFEYCEPQPNQ